MLKYLETSAMDEHHNKNEIDKVDPITETTLENDAEEEIRARVAVSVNHRRLNPRQIQLTAIAGSIGAALFVAIGSGVLSGPLCLLIGMSLLYQHGGNFANYAAFLFWASVVFSIAQCRESETVDEGLT